MSIARDVTVPTWNGNLTLSEIKTLSGHIHVYIDSWSGWSGVAQLDPESARDIRDWLNEFLEVHDGEA